MKSAFMCFVGVGMALIAAGLQFVMYASNADRGM